MRSLFKREKVLPSGGRKKGKAQKNHPDPEGITFG
jgi:hypothetical protein